MLYSYNSYKIYLQQQLSAVTCARYWAWRLSVMSLVFTAFLNSNPLHIEISGVALPYLESPLGFARLM